MRFTFDNNYFNDRWQGIPIGGYNKLVDGLLAGVEVRCDTDFFADRTHWESLCDRIVSRAASTNTTILDSESLSTARCASNTKRSTPPTIRASP